MGGAYDVIGAATGAEIEATGAETEATEGGATNEPSVAAGAMVGIDIAGMDICGMDICGMDICGMDICGIIGMPIPIVPIEPRSGLPNPAPMPMPAPKPMPPPRPMPAP
jgi:hypothetical protein